MARANAEVGAARLARLSEIALALPEAHRVDVEAWGDDVTFRIRNKLFVIAGPTASSCTVKLPLEEATAVLATDRRVTSTGYGLGRHGWITVDLAGPLSERRWREIEQWVRTSYLERAPKTLAKQLLDEEGARRPDALRGERESQCAASVTRH